MSTITVDIPSMVRGCTGKFAFRTATKAWDVAKRMSRRAKRSHGETPL